MALKRAVIQREGGFDDDDGDPWLTFYHLLGTGVLGDSFGTFADGVLGQFTG